MSEIINQMANEMNCKIELITNVVIDEENHMVDFECGGKFWAKLSKNNKNVRKNTVRTNN